MDEVGLSFKPTIIGTIPISKASEIQLSPLSNGGNTTVLGYSSCCNKLPRAAWLK